MGMTLFPENMKQWKVVLVAFATAATFWFFNSLNKNYTTNLNYPVVYQYNQDSLVSVRKLPSSIELDVSGGGWSLLRRTAIFSPEPVTIDLTDILNQSSLSWIEMLPAVRDQITDLNVNQILEDTLSIQIEPLRSAWVRPLVDSASIKLEANYQRVSPINIGQDSVRLTGPKSFIDTIGTYFLVSIPDRDIDETYFESVRVSNHELVTSNPPTVEVRFEVALFKKMQIDVPLEVSNLPADSSLRPEHKRVNVEFVIREDAQETYRVSDFTVVADWKMMRRADSTVLPILTLFPPQIINPVIRPEVVKVIKK